MALFSAKTLITARIVLLGYIGYQLMVSPRTVIEYSGVMVLASSMNLPLLMVNEKSPIYGTIGVMIYSMIVSDVASLLDGNIAYFESVVFVRLLVFFGLTAYSYLGTWIVLCNSVVFGYCFVELWFGILTFSTLKEEKYARVKKQMEVEHEMKEKYERNELSESEKADFEEKLKKEEYSKIMSEFD